MATRDYSAPGLTIHWDSTLCYHAAECVKAQPAVFDPTRKPWIVTDDAAGDDIAAAIDKCPSGALTYTRVEDDAADGPAASISVRPGGPLVVSGELEVVDDHGAVVRRATRLALCRCGSSATKPYCDGTHASVDFDDPGVVDAHPGADG
jgi:uncharacterized Fe-S cluster protein YjdI/CDGSH-type Zn-finger protein